MSARRHRWEPALVALLLLGSACEHYKTPNRPLPANLRFTLLDGAVLDARALDGKPWVIVLWVPGCSICARELPRFEEVRQRYEPQGVGFIAVSLEPDTAEVRRAAELFKLGGHVATVEDEILAPLGVGRVPSLVFVDGQGVVVAAASGERSVGFLERRTRALLH